MDTGKDMRNNTLKPGEAVIKPGKAAEAAGGLQAAETGSPEELLPKPSEKAANEPESGLKPKPVKAESAAEQGKERTFEPNNGPAPVPEIEQASRAAEKQASESENKPEKELYSVDWISLILVIICLVNIFYWYRNLEVVDTTDSRVFLAYPVENSFKNVDPRSSVHEGVLPPAPAPKEETLKRDNNVRGADGKLSDGLPHSDDGTVNNDIPGADGRLSDGLPHSDDGTVNNDIPGADGNLSDGLPHSGDGAVNNDIPGADGRLSDGLPHSGDGTVNNDIPGADGRLSDGLPHNEDAPGYGNGQSDNGEAVSDDVLKSVKRPPGADN